MPAQRDFISLSGVPLGCIPALPLNILSSVVLCVLCACLLQLHKRFVDAVSHLGIKNAVPKTIMQLMNVEGLTRYFPGPWPGAAGCAPLRQSFILGSSATHADEGEAKMGVFALRQ